MNELGIFTLDCNLEYGVLRVVSLLARTLLVKYVTPTLKVLFISKLRC